MRPGVAGSSRAIFPALRYPPVMVSEAQTTPRSRDPRHVRFSHAGVVEAGEGRGQVEPSRQCILCHAAPGSSTRALPVGKLAVKGELSAVEPALRAVEGCATGIVYARSALACGSVEDRFSNALRPDSAALDSLRSSRAERSSQPLTLVSWAEMCRGHCIGSQSVRLMQPPLDFSGKVLPS